MAIYETPFDAKTVEGFLTPEECEEIIFIANRVSPWDNANSEFWNDKVLNDVTIYSRVNKDLGKFLIGVRQRIAEKIKELYGLDQDVYSDVQQIVRWYPGMEMSPHSDNMENTPFHEHHSHRAYGVVIYLNDDYSGGNTFYPQHNHYIQPKTGMLAVHPSDVNHMHGVSMVSENTRYTLVSFWTFDKDKQQDLSAYL
jgi:hypothetical protein